MISQPTDPTTYKPQQLWQIRTLVVSATLIVLLFGWFVGQDVIRQVGKFATDTWHCMTTECNPKGSSAAWQEQFASADSAARKLDPEAVLMEVHASPAAFNFTTWHNDDALEVTFNYILPDGTLLDVELLDTQPATITTSEFKADHYSDRTLYREYTQHKAEIEASLARIALTPRQAIEATVTQVRAMEQAAGKEVQPYVHLYPYYFIEDRVQGTNWYANYALITNGKTDYSNILMRPEFTIDTSTGAVENITKTEDPLNPTP